jgi:hypothetical protein
MSKRDRRYSVVGCRLSACAMALVLIPSAFGADPPAGAPSDKPAFNETVPLDKQVISLLQRTAKALESRSIEPDEEADFRALAAAMELLKADRTILAGERVRLEGLVRIRLRHAADTLTRQEAREAKSKPVARLPDAPPLTILAQQLPGGGGQGPGQAFAGGIGTQQPVDTEKQAEKLIDLIQSIISPNSWDVNGGQGVIRYWSLGHGLVIRNTHAEHDKVGDVLEQLR